MVSPALTPMKALRQAPTAPPTPSPLPTAGPTAGPSPTAGPTAGATADPTDPFTLDIATPDGEGGGCDCDHRPDRGAPPILTALTIALGLALRRKRSPR